MAFTSVQGKVSRVFFEGRGAEVTETFTVKGKEITKRWTCWFENQHGLSEGELVEVSGMHSDEVDEWTDKESQVRHTVKRSLNGAKVKGEARKISPVPDSYTDGVPF